MLTFLMRYLDQLLCVKDTLLIVDAQGIQLKTISNLYLAFDNDLEIIPVLNKIDLPSADPEVVKDQIIDLIGCEDKDIIPALQKQD